ncbi:hypothetical protein V6N13_043357 [Hibiscus sabdariffa]
MADSEGNWRRELFKHLLPWDILLRIATLKGPKASLNGDCIGWAGYNDRKFTIKSAYRIRTGFSEESIEPIWKKIQRYHGIQCIRIFMWLACQRKLMTND